MSADLLHLLQQLGLKDDSQQEFACDCLLDAEQNDEDRTSIIQCMLPDPGEASDEQIEGILKLAEVERQQKRELKLVEKPSKARTQTIPKGLSAEEEKAYLLSTYGNVEMTEGSTIGPSEDAQAEIFNAKAKGRKKNKLNDNILADPLLYSNDNSARIKAAETAKRTEESKNAAMRRERDKAALTKQRDDQAKRKIERTQKAAKVERRA